MGDEERAHLRAARRERIAKDAAAQLAALEADQDEPEGEAPRPGDLRDLRLEGDLGMYTLEMQRRREDLFEAHPLVNKWLDRWWAAAERYFDERGVEGRKDGKLSADEYKK